MATSTAIAAGPIGVADASSVAHAYWDGLRPPPRLTVSEWADRYRILPLTAAEPGRWRTSRTPYLRQIMDVLSPADPAEFVVFMKAAQLGATEAGNNWLGYCIHHAPALMLMVYPGLAEVKRNTSTRIDPLIASTPELKERVVEPRSRDGGNSIFRKKFPGGELVMTGSNSAVGLRSTPARYLFLDEVDGYPGEAGVEGDPVNLAIQRTVTFRSRRKILMVSTPTIEGRSRIQAAYWHTDQRRYFVPCRQCSAFATVDWVQIKWPERAPDRAVWLCPNCGAAHEEHHKKALLSGGQWRPTAAGDGRHVGFHLSALYSPWETWGDIAADFVRTNQNPAQFKTWVNTKLGETWRERGEAPEWERLYERRETYPIGVIPAGGLLLTAGVDVQQDRIEAEVVAWGRDQQSWSVDYRVLTGNTSRLDDPVWDQLSAVLDEVWPHVSGVDMPLTRLAIDDGYNSQLVRAWARRHPGPRVLVTKGQDRMTVPISRPSAVDVDIAGRKIRGGMRVWPIGVSLLKTELYGWLRMARPTDEALARGETFPPGYCHLPEYGEEHFRQLCAEQLQKRETRKGYDVWEWAKTRDRNESLDCRIYARAAACQAGVLRLGPKRWRELEAQFPTTSSAAALVSAERVERTEKRPTPVGTAPAPAPVCRAPRPTADPSPRPPRKPAGRRVRFQAW